MSENVSLVTPYTSGLMWPIILEALLIPPMKMSSYCHLALLSAVEKAQASLIFCSLKMTYFFCLETCRILFSPPYSLKFLWNYVMVLLLLLILPGTLDILPVIFSQYDVSPCFLWLLILILLLAPPVRNPFYLKIQSLNITTSLELFSYCFHSFSIQNIVIWIRGEGADGFFNRKKLHRMTIVK